MRTILSLITAGFVMAYATNSPPTKGSSGQDILSCLNDQGLTIYGTEWCPGCKAMREKMGAEWKRVNFIDCDKNKSICEENSVPGYPAGTLEKGPNRRYVFPVNDVLAVAALSNCVSEDKRIVFTEGSVGVRAKYNRDPAAKKSDN